MRKRARLDWDTAPAVMRPEEAARLLGIGRTACYEAARTGRLPFRRLGGIWLVGREELREWFAAAQVRDGRGLPTPPLMREFDSW